MAKDSDFRELIGVHYDRQGDILTLLFHRRASTGGGRRSG